VTVPPGEAAAEAALAPRLRRARVGAAPDEELVVRAQAGDAEAYGELVRRHRPAALRVAASVLGTAQGADAPDDVVQAASERAWRAIDRIEAARAFRPWFLTIVANGARNDRRARGRRGRLAQRVAARTASGVVTPEEAAVERDEHGQVARAFGRLAEGDQVVLALRHVERMSEREMATALDCAPGTVKSRLSRATVRLRRQLAAVVAVAAVVSLAVGTIAPVREAVAGWLGIGSTRVDQAPADDGRERPAVGEGLEPATDAEVEEALGATPRSLGLGTSALGPPELVALAPEGGVILSWSPEATTLWVRPQAADGVPVGPFVKRPTGPRPLGVRDVEGLGDRALLIEGDHVLDTPGRSLAADTAVLWLDGGREFRLEGTVPGNRLVTIARSFDPPG
jgi:RNA polymerase sigma-70 factor (ECF subfamily)